MHDPIGAAFQYLRDRLGPDVGGLVSAAVEHPAPQDAAWPVVTWQVTDTTDALGLGTIRHLTVVEVLVRAVASETSTVALAPTASAIDAALVSGVSRVYDLGQVYGCVRLRPFRMTEMDSGQRLTHLGGIYRISVGP